MFIRPDERRRPHMPISLRLALTALLGLLAAACATTESEPRTDAEGFVSLFDGRTLAGWKAPDMTYWTVEDGAITATISEAHPLAKNQYLTWQGGELGDFELKLTFRLTGSPSVNGGFQFRSKAIPDDDIAGYQVDNNLDTDWCVRLYDEHGREDLARRGESARISPEGKREVATIEGVFGKPAHFKLTEWHDYDLIAKGSKLELKVNGVKVADVQDDDPAQQDLSGILALQLHSGKPQKAQFKDIRIKKLGADQPPAR